LPQQISTFNTHTQLFETCPKIPFEAEKLRHNHLLSTELMEKRGRGKKLLQIIFVCRQNVYLQISYSDRKRNHLPRDPLRAYARLYP
jgi:hypothetical protein